MTALFVASAFAGTCELGPAASNLIRAANPSARSVDSPEEERAQYNLIQTDTLGITFAIEWAEGWRKWWIWNRNLVGLVPSETINSINRQSDEAGLPPAVWHASRFDSDTILSAKSNVIKAALSAKSRGFPLQGAISTTKINSVTPENSEEAAYDILANLKVAAFRQKREYYYWRAIQDKLSLRFGGSYSSVSISQIKTAFAADHPMTNDKGDVAGLKKLMLTRLPNGETLFDKAKIGSLDNSALAQLTGRPNLRQLFSGVCDPAIK